MSLLTCCPSCGTQFRVVSDQLRISDGWVRCGRCQEVFDASQSLQEYHEPEPESLLSRPPAPSVSTGQAARQEPAAAAPAAPLSSAPVVASPSVPAAPTVAPRSAAAPTLVDEPDSFAAAVTSPRPVPRPTPEPEPASKPQLEQFAEPQQGYELSAPADDGPALEEPVASAPAPASQVTPEPEPVLQPEPVLDFELAPEPQPVAAKSEPAPEAPLEPVLVPQQPEPADVPVGTPRRADEPTLDDVVPQAPADAGPAEEGAVEPGDAGGDEGGGKEPPTGSEEARRTTDTDLDETPSFVRQARRQERWRRPWVRMVLGALLLLLPLLLLGQIAVHERNALAARAPALQPVLAALCQALGCQLAPPQDIAMVVISGSSFSEAGPDAGRYRLDVSLRNQSTSLVATPALELTLTDASDQPLARKVFLPADLRAPQALGPRAEWNGSFPVQLNELPQPVVGYRVQLFYP